MMNRDNDPDFVQYLTENFDTRVEDGKLYISADSLRGHIRNLDMAITQDAIANGICRHAYEKVVWIFMNLYSPVDTLASLNLYETIPDYIPLEFYTDEQD